MNLLRLVVLAAFVVVAAVNHVGADAHAATAFKRPAAAVKALTNSWTPTSRSWQLENGQVLTQYAAGMQQYREDGVWKDLDLALRAGGPGWEARPGKLEIGLPGRLDTRRGDLVRVVGSKGDVVRMGLLGAAGAGAASDATATYADVLPKVDLRLQVTPEGLKEDVLLEDREAPRRLTFLLETGSPKLSVRSERSGWLAVVEGDRTAFLVPPPVVHDAAGIRLREARWELRRVGDARWHVAIELDDDWLDDRHRRWPVTVDPSIEDPNQSRGVLSHDCQVWWDGAPSDDYDCDDHDADRLVGVQRYFWSEYDEWPYYIEAGAYVLRFGRLTDVQSDAIESAKLQVSELATHESGSPARVHRLTLYPTTVRSTPGDFLEIPDKAAAEPGSWTWNRTAGKSEFDVTSLVTDWRRDENGSGGHPNNGIVLTDDFYEPILDDTLYCYDNECGGTRIASSVHPTAGLRPVLEVTSWPMAPAGAGMVTPTEGHLTAKRAVLQARATDSSVDSVRFQYVAGSQRTWKDIPLAALSTTDGTALGSVDVPMVSGELISRRVVWDLTAMRGGDVDGPVHVRAHLSSTIPGDGGMTHEVDFRLDRRGIEGGAIAEIGPGEVSLLSGEFTTSATDVSIGAFLQDLTLTRTYKSRGASRRNADMFGPQWEASVEADGGELPYKGLYDYTEVKEEVVERHQLNPAAWNWELFFETFDFESLGADVETVQEIARWDYRYAIVENSDGTKLTFTPVAGTSAPQIWEPDAAHPGYALERADIGGGRGRFTLTEPSGAVATFVSEAADSPAHRIESFRQPGSSTSLSYAYASTGTRQRLSAVTAPTPGGATRSLEFNWGSVSVSGVPGVTRVDRVTSVRFNDGTTTATTVAEYAYDTKGRLTSASDPRYGGTGLPTTYAYDGSSRLSEIRPAGEEEWRLAYTTASGDAGLRLASISRDHPVSGVATETVRYGVPVTGSGAPYDLGASETGRWGQEEVEGIAWDAVALFREDDVPSGTPPDYSRATIHYVGVHGRTVNVAEPGGKISTSRWDANGNLRWTLTPGNRERALAAGGDTARRARELTTAYVYASNTVDLLSVSEPTTQITLSDGRVVTGRRTTLTSYETGSGVPPHLVNDVARGVDTGTTTYADLRRLKDFGYDAHGGMSGWRARTPTTVTADPDGLALRSWSILHPDHPVVEETRTPEGSGGAAGPDVQWHQYYGITPSSRVPRAITGACSGLTGTARPRGFLCFRSEDAAGDAQVPRRWYEYNALGLVTDLWETRPNSRTGTGYRKTTTGYDAAGRMTSDAVTGGSGTAVPATTYTYAAATGRPYETTASGPGTVRRTYNSNGRLSTYVDAGGTSTSYAYDLRGRVTQRTIGGRTTRYGYDARDDVTSVTDSVVGAAVTATYGADGELLTETLPNGVLGSFTYDATGRALRTTWDDTTRCSSGCTWVESEVTGRNADGDVVGHDSTQSEQDYAYDTARRLTRVDDVRLSDRRCVRRTYAYDVESNRTQRDVQTARAGDACGTGTTVTRTWTHDDADRVTSSGWTHDAFGRATAVPAADSGGAGALAGTYHVDDQVRSLTLDGRTHTYDRDPLDRTKRIVSNGAGDWITSWNLYADDSDSPVGISRDDSSSATYVDGPSGQLVATLESGELGDTFTYQLRDVHGSVVALTSQSAGENRPIARTETDEFGVVTTTGAQVIDNTKGVPANGWLGTHQRTTQFGQREGSGGPMEMGARVYLPAVGRFLQVDPVDGGSANAYDYVDQNPVNVYDLTGRCPVCIVGAAVAGRIAAGYLLKKAAQKAASKGASKTSARLMERSSKNLSKAQGSMAKHEEKLLEWIWKKDGVRQLKIRGVNVKLAIHDHAGGPHKGLHIQGNGWQVGVKDVSVVVRHFVEGLV